MEKIEISIKIFSLIVLYFKEMILLICIPLILIILENDTPFPLQNISTD